MGHAHHSSRLTWSGIAEVIAGEGLPRLWRRPDAERGGPVREIQARAEVLDFTALARRPRSGWPGCDYADLFTPPGADPAFAVGYADGFGAHPADAV